MPRKNIDQDNIAQAPQRKEDLAVLVKRHSSITFDMDIYMTLTDLKRMKKLSIHKYCNDAIRKFLERDFAEYLEQNKKFL